MVELFGGWVADTEEGDFAASTREAPDSFMETLGVETVAPQQIRLVTNFAELLKQKREANTVP